ncbi:TonB-dependent siderophore receptor [Phenylobacterium sp. LjRoot225]|uniref:TonB-dependent siderophore receptor n=1 Tax=Phenylobacterium sp. LjRoot225 TaxID=3342285 RepID=UPI003ECF4178
MRAVSGVAAKGRNGAALAVLASAILSAPPAWAEESEEQVFAEADAIVVNGARPVKDGAMKVGAAKVDAPLRDIPQSIQVVSGEFIRDLVALRVEDVVQQVSGVARGNTSLNGDSFIFRGFSTSDFLRNGYPDRRASLRDLAAIERIEVIKGPASALYGRSEPGGTLNYVTKEPLAAPFREVSLLVDSFGYVNPAVDLSTMTADGKLGARVVGAFQDGGNFRDHSFAKRNFGSAAISWRPGENTRILFNFEALDDNRSWDRGLPSTAAGPAPVSITTLVSEPTDFRKVREQLVSYTLDHAFSPTWRVRQAVLFSRSDSNNVRTRFVNTTLDLATGLIDRDRLGPRTGFDEQVSAQLELAGEFTGPAGVRHKVLIGGDLDRYKSGDHTFQGNTLVASNRINIYAPVYGNFVARGFRESSNTVSTINADGVYIQDLIELSPKVKAMASLRYDRSESISDNLMRNTTSKATTDGYSPRVGLVWQPNDKVSLYGSFSQSFVPVVGQDFAGELFKPTIGKQYEVGVKTELFDNRLFLTMAAFQIRKRNMSVPDLDHEGFNIQTGEVTSEGVEVDARVRPAPGFDITGSLSLMDVRITRDTRAGAVGRRPANVPNTSAGLWASYALQNERLAGWSVAMGGAYVGRREVNDLGGAFTLAPYVRVDASLRYEAETWRVAVKVNNLFDKRHFVNGSDGRIDGVYPGAPRNVALTTSIQF